jgi:hypothetical protein
MADSAPDNKIPGDFRLLLTRVLDNGDEVVQRVYRPTEIVTECTRDGWTITGTGCALSLPEDGKVGTDDG